MVIELIPLTAAFIGTVVAAIWDLKTTEVPDQVPYAMIAIGVLFYGYQSIVGWTFYPIASSLISGLVFLAFGAFMYYTGQWGGADSLILSAIGFLLPYAPQGFAKLLFPFPASYFMNLFVLGAVYMILYAFVFALRNRVVFSGFVNDVKASATITALSIAGLFVVFYLASLNLGRIMYGSFDFVWSLYISLFPVASIILLYIIWRFAKAVETHGFRRKILVDRLKVGDMLAGEKKLVGITEQQIKSLKRSRQKHVWIKDGVRFAPVFVLALIVTLYYGDVMVFLANVL